MILELSNLLRRAVQESLEDRVVKRFMRDKSRPDPLPSSLPVPASMLRAEMRLVGKARRPRSQESQDNPRARSAVIRVAEKLV